MQLCRKLLGCKPTSSPNDTRSVATKAPPTVSKSDFITAGILGEGGFGKVMTGMMLRNSTWYAIKEIRKVELVKHKMGMAMIFSELEAMKRMDHPAVINLHFSFHDHRRCFFVMDLMTGGDLRYYLRKRYLFEEGDVAFYVACISSALEHIHSRNVIHRDIKPENIILDERGYPYLTDFGVAHVQDPYLSDNTLTCTLASGTKQYLAPEIFTKAHIHGPEVDFWALGVVAFELLFARRPFDKHCPISFITYLEKALLQKRKQVKEMKSRQHLSSLHASHEFAEGMLSSSLGRESRLSASLPASFELASSPSRFSLSYKELRLSGGKLQRSSLKATAATPSPARTSTDLSSSENHTKRDSLHFCSSVGYTNISGNIMTGTMTPEALPRSNRSSVPSPSQYLQRDDGEVHMDKSGSYKFPSMVGDCSSMGTYAHGGISRNVSDDSMFHQNNPLRDSMGSQDGGNKKVLPELKLSRSGSPLKPSPVFSRSKSSRRPPSGPPSACASPSHQQHKKLSVKKKSVAAPPLPVHHGGLGSADHSPPRGLQNDNTETEDYGEILLDDECFSDAEEVSHSQCHQSQMQSPSYLKLEEECDEDQDDDHEARGYVRALPGDHWLVEDGPLHHTLYVDIPDSTPWLGLISPECQRVLAGLFEVRPSHRLGARNLQTLRRCKWFQIYRLQDWDQLLIQREYQPRFQPGKRFIRECLDRMDEMGEAQMLGEDDMSDDSVHNLCDLNQDLTADEEAAFEPFLYIAARHQHLFPEPVTIVFDSKTDSAVTTPTSVTSNRRDSQGSKASQHFTSVSRVIALDK